MKNTHYDDIKWYRSRHPLNLESFLMIFWNALRVVVSKYLDESQAAPLISE